MAGWRMGLQRSLSDIDTVFSDIEAGNRTLAPDWICEVLLPSTPRPCCVRDR